MASTLTAADAAATSFADTSEAYRDLLASLQQIKSLEQAAAVLHYDQMVSMPAAAAAARGAQMSALATIIHEKSTDPKLAQLLAKAEKDLEDYGEGAVQKDENHVLGLARKDIDKKQKIPSELEARRASLSASAYGAWVEARKANDFKAFQPVLQDCFDTSKETAGALRGENISKSHYTVLLDEFERGMPAERIDDLFDRIQEKLVPLLKRVLESETPPSDDCLKGTFDVDAQQSLSREIVTSLGFDETHGRIDVSVHPFTTSFSTSDVRITSRFSNSEWYQGLAGSVHEAGHAMYEQNLGPSNTEVDSFLSMGCHESQSLFWERHIGLSKPFWKWATPLLHKHFTVAAEKDWSADDVYGAVNRVLPGLIRVEADELTYPLHVILRYQLERQILQGGLDICDLPRRWNQGMKDMLDVHVPTDADGCLQDVHWSGLAIGYFPTYLLGAATAAQLAYYCEKDIEDFEGKIASGDFAPIKAWLTDKIHRHGRRYDSLDALLLDQLGEPLNPDYLIDYLTEKYTDLYKC
jgi:carboxypeptidase Taq